MSEISLFALAPYTIRYDNGGGSVVIPFRIEAEREIIFARLRDSDATAPAAHCEDNAVPQDCQARAEGIAHPSPEQS
jgi:hypothetical protein